MIGELSSSLPWKPTSLQDREASAEPLHKIEYLQCGADLFLPRITLSQSLH